MFNTDEVKKHDQYMSLAQVRRQLNSKHEMKLSVSRQFENDNDLIPFQVLFRREKKIMLSFKVYQSFKISD